MYNHFHTYNICSVGHGRRAGITYTVVHGSITVRCTLDNLKVDWHVHCNLLTLLSCVRLALSE